MAVKELLKEAVAIMNLPLLDDDNRNKLKDILCYLSEWKANNNSEAGNYPQLDFVLYNASRKLRTFGYNRLNKFENEIINNGDELSILRDETIDKYYKTESGFVLDKLQKAVLDEFEDSHQKLFLSAPTSFGKTFLLKEIIFRHHKEYSNIIIVLPTVALLMEVTGEIEEFNNKHFLNYNLYNSIYRDLELSDRNIFILTPERVLRLFAIIPDINIDFFFFDEIYKIDEDVSIKSEDDVNEKIEFADVNSVIKTKPNEEVDKKSDHRAVAFRLALYFLLKRCKAFYLAGPFIELSELREGFKRMLELHDITAKEISFNPTLKNIIDFHAKTYSFKSPFENITIRTDVKKSREKLIYVSQKLGVTHKNQAIVYCLNPAGTEKYAKQYSEYFKTQVMPNNDLQQFIDHIKRNYNFKVGVSNYSVNNWDFLDALQNQVGVHNGKLPKYFQREIIRLFNDGAMSTLFCTSTIVEGVNTNAKTVVVYNNPSGKTDEGKRFLLLNINGRAGRYLHHFIGNIVFLNLETIRISESDSISLDFKPYNLKLTLSNLDLENIDDGDLSKENLLLKTALGFDKQLLPDDVFQQNRLIERKKQEKVLLKILSNISLFVGIENVSVEKFLNEGYFESILKIWAEIGEITPNQIKAIKYFSIQYAKNGYRGVLEYQFKRYSEKTDIHDFVNKSYHQVFKNVKDTIEYQLPRVISLFESLIILAFQKKNISIVKPVDLSNIIRFFEIGSTTPLGVDMAEKGVPIVTVKKIDNIPWGKGDLQSQREVLLKRGGVLGADFAAYEIKHIQTYIDKYCK